MRKSLLAKIPLKEFQYISLEQLRKNIELIYSARRIHVGNEYILEVAFYCLKQHRIVYRIFFSKNDYAVQIFDEDGSGKYRWSTIRIDNSIRLEPYMSISSTYRYIDNTHTAVYHYNYCGLNKKTEDVITSFMAPKLKHCQEAANAGIMMLQFQSMVQEKLLAKKHKRITDRIDAELTGVQKLPADIKSWIVRVPLKQTEYIFYKRKGKKTNGYCSACKKEVELSTAYHKTEGICPCCGNNITFLAAGKRKKRIIDEFVFTYIQRFQEDGIMLRIFEGSRTFNEDFKAPVVSFREERRYVIDGGMSTKTYYYGDFKNTGNIRWCDTVPGRYYYTHPTDVGYLYTGNLHNQFKGTYWQDCRIEQFGIFNKAFDAYSYLKTYYRHNGLSYLVDHKLYLLAAEAFTGYSYSMFDKNHVFDLLAKHKQFIKMFSKIEITWEELKMVDKFSSSKHIKEDVLLWTKENVRCTDFGKIIKHTTPIKAINYITKQVGLSSDSANDTLITWLDCLGYAKKFKLNTADSYILFPKNLKNRHDEYVAEDTRIEENKRKAEDRLIQRKIKALSKELNKQFAYESDNFIVRAPKSVKEIIDEGTELHHCVRNGYYARNMADGKTIILFLRQKPDIDTPFCTLEYANGELRQCRMNYNNSPDKQVQQYRDEWLEHITKKNKQMAIAA